MNSSSASQPIQFLLSIDTEEEWDWSGPYPQDDCSIENIDHLPEFHKECEALGVRPTYLVDYAVISNASSAQHIQLIHQTGNCEVGAHLHPWCTPPYNGVTGDFESHVVNLPVNLVEQKLDQLTNAIEKTIGARPRSFRTGRWGINTDVMKLLVDKGYQIDSSVIPYYSNTYFSCEGAEEKPYWPDLNNVLQPGSQREIFELPVTAGFNWHDFERANQLHETLAKAPWNFVRAIGVLWHTKVLRKIYLSPELSDPEDMIDLIEQSISRGNRHIHMFFHSSSLLPGAACFADQNKRSVTEGLKQVVEYLKTNHEVVFHTLSESLEYDQRTQTSL